MPTRRSLILIAAAAALALAAALAPRPVAADSIVIALRNQSGEKIRCVSQFAHYVTAEEGTWEAGASLTLRYDRDPALGTLSRANAAGRAMMLERLVCGTAAGWSATHAPVPLLSVLHAAPVRYTADCQLEGRLFCDPPTP
jgi:hypothetical protein